MENRCFHRDELEAILALDPDDPRLAHADDCPACRALIQSYRSFMEPGGEASPEEREDAGRRLAGFIEKEVGVSGGRDEKVVPFRRRLRTWFAGGRLRPALAAAAIVVIILTVPLLGRGPGEAPITGVLRENGAGTALQGEARALDGGRLELEWTSQEDADSYSVIIYGADLEELARFGVENRVSFIFDPETIPRSAQSPTLLFRVLALRGGDEIARSGLQVLLEG